MYELITLREHNQYYGLLKKFDLPIVKKYYFEQLLKSCCSLDPYEKIRILLALPKLTIDKINSLIEVFDNELFAFKDLNYKHPKDVKTLMIKIKLEWRKIEMNLENYTSEDIEIDKSNNMTPKSIKKTIEKYVKGQGKAVETLSTLLYYHLKIHSANDSRGKHELPYKPLNPILIAGSTGTGKSFLIETGASLIGLTYHHVDCSSLVSAGIVGYTIDDIMKDLLRKVNYKTTVAETAIVVFDEIDKLIEHHDGLSIMHQLLRITEGTFFPIDHYKAEDRLKNIQALSTHKMLFIFAGSFQNIIYNDNNNIVKDSSIEKTKLPKELLGRINQIIILNKLTKKDLKNILLTSEISPLEDIKKMFKVNNIDLEVSDNTIERLVDKAHKSTYGARALNRITWDFFQKYLYSAPSYKTKKIIKL